MIYLVLGDVIRGAPRGFVDPFVRKDTPTNHQVIVGAKVCE